MDAGDFQLLLIAINILIGIVSFLTSGICILVWNKITTESSNRKASSVEIWKRINSDSDKIHKSELDIIKIATSLGIDLK